MTAEDDRSWKSRRVLVTGATGFIGANLVRSLLGRGATVACLVCDEEQRSPLWLDLHARCASVVEGRLEKLADVLGAVRGAAPLDVIFHLGAQALVGVARREPLSTLEVNVRGTWNLLEACRRHAPALQAVIVASSDKAYGRCSDLPCREETPLNGRFPYDASKACADIIAQSYAQSYDLPVGIARCGNVFGPGDVHWTRLVPGTIRSLLRGERPVVRSDGRLVRDWLFVDDAVRGYLALADALATMPRASRIPIAFNFSMERPLTVLQMVGKLAAAAGRADLEALILDEAEGEITAQHLDAARARSVLCWSARRDLEESLLETLAWYRQHLAAAAAVISGVAAG